MPRKKIKTSVKGEWVHRPGFNWLLGYVEEKPIPKSEGIKVYTIDRTVKDGSNNNSK